MKAGDGPVSYRVILYHKQATSARTRFLRYAQDTVLAFGPLAHLSQMTGRNSDAPRVHPSSIMQQLESWLGLPRETITAETGFQHAVEIPGGEVHILLASITTIDPPFDAAEKVGAKFIDLTEARGLPPVELELLRHAYERVLGG